MGAAITDLNGMAGLDGTQGRAQAWEIDPLLRFPAT